jgi:hypothetical protein
MQGDAGWPILSEASTFTITEPLMLPATTGHAHIVGGVHVDGGGTGAIRVLRGREIPAGLFIDSSWAILRMSENRSCRSDSRVKS